jgi:hypothetical protein
MQKPTFEDYMKLLAEISGYGNVSTRVKVGYMPAKKYDITGDSDGYDFSDWGYSISVEMCTTNKYDNEVSAQDKDLLVAMKLLTDKAFEWYTRRKQILVEDEAKAKKAPAQKAAAADAPAATEA